MLQSLLSLLFSLFFTSNSGLAQGSQVDNELYPNAHENGGNIIINAGSLALTNGAQVDIGTFGEGNAGSIRINARDTVTLDGKNTNIYSLLESLDLSPTFASNGGNINITTGSLALANGAALGTGIDGQGNAGNIAINARDTISFDGSTVLSSFAEAVGNGGNINITTGSLALTNGALLSNITYGGGNAGSLTINARDSISLDGVSRNGSLP